MLEPFQIGGQQELIDRLQQEFGVVSEEIDMFYVDVPFIDAPVVLTRTAATSRASREVYLTLGQCDLHPVAEQMTPEYYKAGYYALNPRLIAHGSFFGDAVNQSELALDKSEVQVTRLPAHGKLSEPLTLQSVDKLFAYYPDRGFVGNDRVDFVLTAKDGRKVRVIHFIKVGPKFDAFANPNVDRYSRYCPAPNPWKISSVDDGSQELQDNASNDPVNTTADTTNSGFPFGPLSSNHEGVRYAGLGSTNADSPYTFNNISVTFAALEGQAVGNTMGEGPTAQITLDKDAAGHGWFIDTTPVKGVWLDLISGYPRNQRVPQRVNGCGVEIYFRKNTPRACGYTGQRAVTDSVNGCAG